MSNLIERLRDPLDSPETKSVFDLCREAADEIERLEIEGNGQLSELAFLDEQVEELVSDNKSLICANEHWLERVDELETKLMRCHRALELINRTTTDMLDPERRRGPT